MEFPCTLVFAPSVSDAEYSTSKGGTFPICLRSVLARRFTKTVEVSFFAYQTLKQSKRHQLTIIPQERTSCLSQDLGRCQLSQREVR